MQTPQGCSKTVPPEQVTREGDGEKGKSKPLSLCNLNSRMMSYSCHALLVRHSSPGLVLRGQAWAHPEVSVAGVCLDVHRDTVLYAPSHGLGALMLTGSITVSTWACVWMPGSRSLPRSHYSLLQDQDGNINCQTSSLVQFQSHSHLWEDKQEVDC